MQYGGCSSEDNRFSIFGNRNSTEHISVLPSWAGFISLNVEGKVLGLFVEFQVGGGYQVGKPKQLNLSITFKGCGVSDLSV